MEDQVNDNALDAAKKKEILESLFGDPYFKAVARRIRKKTGALPVQGRKMRRLLPPKKGPEEGAKEPQDSPGTKRVVLSVESPEQLDKMLEQIESGGRIPEKGRKVVLDVDSPAQLDSMVDQLEQERRVPERSQKVILDDPGSLDQVVANLEKGKSPSFPVKGKVVSVEKPPPSAFPSSRQSSLSTKKVIINASDPEALDRLVRDIEVSQRPPAASQKVLIGNEDPESLERAIKSIEAGKTKENPDILIDMQDSEQYMDRVARIEKSGRAPMGAAKVVLEAETADAFDDAIEELEKNYMDLLEEANQYDEDISWLLEQLSKKMSHIPNEVFKKFVEQIQRVTKHLPQIRRSKKGSVSTISLTKDDIEYARQIEVEVEDLHEAMQEEGIKSVEELYNSFREMGGGTFLSMENFDIFVKTLVQSYVDRKNEDALLGLIGVSSKTGRQELSTSYARLLAEIFRQEIGGLFLNQTKNSNYNAFNIGNVIQENLLSLEEMERVSYLENILALLNEKQSLLAASKNRVSSTISKTYFIKLFPNQNELLLSLEKYFADLALFKLGLTMPEDLPDDVMTLLPSNIYEFLDFVTGFPKSLVQKNSKVIYMLKKLSEDDPLLFVSKRSMVNPV